jgi:hypothetical protein
LCANKNSIFFSLLRTWEKVSLVTRINSTPTKWEEIQCNITLHLNICLLPCSLHKCYPIYDNRYWEIILWDFHRVKRNAGINNFIVFFFTHSLTLFLLFLCHDNKVSAPPISSHSSTFAIFFFLNYHRMLQVCLWH